MTINTTSVQSASIALNAESNGYTLNAVASYGAQTAMYASNGISNGTVSYDNATVASFTSSSSNNLSIFFNVSSKEQKAEILEVVEQFCSDTRTFIENCEVTVLSPITTNDKED